MSSRDKLLYGLDKVPFGETTMDARDIPEPFRTQFLKAMYGQAIPGPAPHIHYAHDWLEWASGTWRWGDRPMAPDLPVSH